MRAHPEKMEGPPFAISPEAVRAYYPHASVELLEEKPAISENLRKTGAAFERCYLITL